MAANWDILNKEFDSLLDRISNDDWNNWASTRDSKKWLRRELMVVKAKIHSTKMQMKEDNSCAYELEANMTIQANITIVLDFDTKRQIVKKASSEYNPPLAA